MPPMLIAKLKLDHVENSRLNTLNVSVLGCACWEGTERGRYWGVAHSLQLLVRLIHAGIVAGRGGGCDVPFRATRGYLNRKRFFFHSGVSHRT